MKFVKVSEKRGKNNSEELLLNLNQVISIRRSDDGTTYFKMRDGILIDTEENYGSVASALNSGSFSENNEKKAPGITAASAPKVIRDR